MKTAYFCALSAFCLLTACDVNVKDEPPSTNTTVVTPGKEEKKETNTTIVNPPKEEKKVENNTTVINPPKP